MESREKRPLKNALRLAAFAELLLCPDDAAQLRTSVYPDRAVGWQRANRPLDLAKYNAEGGIKDTRPAPTRSLRDATRRELSHI